MVAKDARCKTGLVVLGVTRPRSGLQAKAFGLQWGKAHRHLVDAQPLVHQVAAALVGGVVVVLVRQPSAVEVEAVAAAAQPSVATNHLPEGLYPIAGVPSLAVLSSDPPRAKVTSAVIALGGAKDGGRAAVQGGGVAVVAAAAGGGGGGGGGVAAPSESARR